MKKVIAMAVVLGAALFFALYYQISTVGVLETSAYALPDNSAAQNLQKDAKPSKANIQPLSLNEMDTVYERAGALYVGEKKDRINESYPLFLKERDTLYLVSDTGRLVTNTFENLTSYYGLYVSDGMSFNSDGKRADTDEFILLNMNNGAYVNVQGVSVTGRTGRKNVAANSMIGFAEDSIRYYDLENEEFVYHTITGLGSRSTIKIGENNYNYHTLLQSLGIMPVPIDEEKVEKVEEPEVIVQEEDPELEELLLKEMAKEILPPEEESNPQVEVSVSTDDEDVVWVDPEILEEDTDEFKIPRMRLGEFRGNWEREFAVGKISMFDPSEALKGEVRVVVQEQGSPDDPIVWKYKDFQDVVKSALKMDLKFRNLKVDTQYLVYGEYSYLDENGVLQENVRFGTQVFVITEIAAKKRKASPPGRQLPPVYYDPYIVTDDFTSSVYFLHGNVKVLRDEAMRIAGPLRFEVYKDGVLYTRKAVFKKGVLDIGQLPPDTTYEVVGTVKYLNKDNKIALLEFHRQTITTRPISDLDPLDMTFTNGDIYSTKVELKNVGFTGTTGAKTVPFVAKITAQFPDAFYNFGGALISKMLAGESVDFTTPPSLDSDSEFIYKLVVFDRYGNELPLSRELTGKTRTCKTLPFATLKVIEDKLSELQILTTVDNPDGAMMTNLQIIIRDVGGNVITTVIEDANGVVSGAELFHPLPDDGGITKYINIPPESVLTAEVIATYDVDDGKGPVTEVVGTLPIRSLDISTLGFAMFNTKQIALGDTTAEFDVRLDIKHTNSALQHLLKQVDFVILDINKNPVQKISIDRSNGLNELFEFDDSDPANISTQWSRPWNLPLDNLDSSTNYYIEIQATVEIGFVDYPVQVTNNFNHFLTYKMEPVVTKSSHLDTNTFIEIYDLYIEDPDGTILSDISLHVSDSYGRIVAVRKYDPNTLYEKVMFDKLIANETYKFTFIATEFNNGYDNSTHQMFRILQPVWEISTDKGLAGRLSFRGLDAIPNSKNFTAHLRGEIQDDNGLLTQSGKYFLHVYRDGEFVEILERDITPPGNPSFMEDFDLTLLPLSDYHIELWISAFGNEIQLSKIDFDTDAPVIGISHVDEFAQLNANKEGRFVVLNDLDMTKIAYSGGATNEFQGTLDFQGYTATVRATRTSTTGIVNYLGGRGVLRNVVMDLEIDHKIAYRYAGYVIYSNQGLLENVIVNVRSNSPYLNNNFSPVVRVNGSSGIIQNFVVKFETPMEAGYTWAGVATHNAGIVRNGYVYGEPITVPDVTVEGGYSPTNIAGVVAVNNLSGTVENVYSLVDIKTGALGTPGKNSFGTVVGSNAGIVRNVYSTGAPIFNGAQELALGPAVGNQSGKQMTTAFYVNNKIYTNQVNTKVTAESLYDDQWQAHVLGRKFDVVNTVRAGFYPHVIMPDNMPVQEYVPLAGQTAGDNIDVSSAITIQQLEHEATASFSFKNPTGYFISAITMDGLQSNIVPGSQIDMDGMSRVEVHLSDPSIFYSKYKVSSFTYGGRSPGSPTQTKVYSDNEKPVVSVEFYKPITNVVEWTGIQGNMAQNYRLKADLDFILTPQKDIRIGGTAPIVDFTGKLDGGIYDDGYNLTGMHTINNIDLSSDIGVNGGGVISTLSGGVTNMKVRNLTLENPKDPRVGFIRVTKAGSYIDNIHIENGSISGGDNIGSIVGRLTYSSVQNSSSVGVSLRNGSQSVSIGGIAGLNEYSFLTNCFVDDLFIESTSQGAMGIGGIVGTDSGGDIENTYAVGVIISEDQNVGGILGSIGVQGLVRNHWSNVSIQSSVDRVGGILGSFSVSEAAMSTLNSLALGDIYSDVSTSEFVRRVVGNSTSLDGMFAWNEQHINGSVPVDGTTGELLPHGAGLFSTEELKDVKTYQRIVRLGSQFDYGQVPTGILPKLYHTGGGLLANQKDQKLTQRYMEIANVVANMVGGEYIAQVTVKHNEGLAIENIALDYADMTATNVFVVSPTETVLEVKINGEPKRYLDSYMIDEILYNGGMSYRVGSQIDFGSPLYLDISSITDWQVEMAERGERYENFRIRENLDFDNRSDILHKIKVNRIIGGTQTGAATLSNIKLTFIEPDTSFINKVNAEISNLKFENVSLTNTAKDNNGFGIVGKLTGVAQDLNLQDFSLVTTGGQNYGAIGWVSGEVSSVVADNVSIRGTIAPGQGGASSASHAGTIIGYAVESDIFNITVTNSKLVGQYYAGGVTGRGLRTIFSDIWVSDTDVTGVSYVGGVIGHHTKRTSDWTPTNYNMHFAKGNVKGVNYIGGISGSGTFVAKDMQVPVTVKDSTIIGTGAYVGGLSGITSDYWNTSGEVHNSKIFGSNTVGGAIGGVGIHPRHYFVLDSVVSTVHDPSYTLHTGAAKIPVTNVNSQNRMIGGITGTRSAMGSGIANSIVGSEGAQYVGGLSAYVNEDGTYYSYVQNTKIYGDTNVGGAFGYHRDTVKSHLYVNADIIGTGNNIGGITGNMYINTALDGSRTSSITQSMFIGTVTGKDYVGGVVGYANAPYFGSNNGHIVAAKITITGGANVSFLSNAPGTSQMTNSRIFDGSRIFQGAVTMKPSDFYGPTDSNRPVTSAQLAQTSTYTSVGYSAISNVTNFSGLANGFMPYTTNISMVPPGLPTAGPLKYQLGKLPDGSYRPTKGVVLYEGGVPIPQSPMGFGMTIALGSSGDTLPTPEVYAVSAGSLNIDFNDTNPETAFRIVNSGEVLVEQSIEERTYTINYDYKTPITLVMTNGHEEVEYEIQPKPLLTTVLTWQDEYYYISDMGVEASGSGLLAGNFINLRGGEALASSGALYSLADGSLITSKVEIGLSEQTLPLYRFTYDGYEIETFHTYSNTGQGSDKAVKPLQLLVKNGELSAVDPQLPIVWDGIILDNGDDGQVLTALGIDQMMGDTKNPIVYPENFKNYDIAELSNSLMTDAPHALVRYKDGTLVGFNYKTGDLLSLASEFSGPTLLEYASDYFTAGATPALSLSEGYLELLSLEETLVIKGLVEVIEGVKNPDALPGVDGDAQTEGKDKLGSDGEKLGTTKEKTEDNLGTDSVAEPPTHGQGGTGEKQGADGTYTASEDTTEAGEKTAGEETTGEETTGEESKETSHEEPVSKTGSPEERGSGLDGQAGGDLALPEKAAKRSYVPVYNVSTQSYELFDESTLLDHGKMEAVAGVDKTLKVSLSEKVDMIDAATEDGIPSPLANKGIVFLVITVVGIAVLLLIIFENKKKIRNDHIK